MNCPLIPMLAITGKPDRKWIHERLQGLRQGGIEQFLIYARSAVQKSRQKFSDFCLTAAGKRVLSLRKTTLFPFRSI